MTLSIVRSALTALAVVLVATPALAQPLSPPAGRPGGDHERRHEMMEQHRAAMVRDLHALLNIRPDQESAFAAFQASMTPPPHADRMKDRQGMMTMTTPQRLDMMLARMDERMAHMRARAQATKTFYAVLSPQQQQAFDALARLHGHGMGGGWKQGGRWKQGGGWMHGGGMHGPGEGPPPPPGA